MSFRFADVDPVWFGNQLGYFRITDHRVTLVATKRNASS
jgi:hypothetical protein